MSLEQDRPRELTFWQKVLIFRDFGFWPACGLVALTMAIESNIQAERNDGKSYCAERKTKTAQRVGLEISLPEAK